LLETYHCAGVSLLEHIESSAAREARIACVGVFGPMFYLRSVKLTNRRASPAAARGKEAPAQHEISTM
jgi:hypothetical protein